MRSNRVGPTFAQVAQLGERQTEDLNVPGSSPGLGMYLPVNNTRRNAIFNLRCILSRADFFCALYLGHGLCM